MIRTKSEDAVSPVIGIMLLLVVTIIIAAVVAAFASGIGSNTEPAPTTVIDVTDISDDYNAKESWQQNTAKRSLLTDKKIDGNTYYYYKDLCVGAKINGKIIPYETPYKTTFFKQSSRETSYPDEIITISSLSGDVLDLQKISIKVQNSEGKLVAEKKQESLSGTLAPGNMQSITLDRVDGGILSNDKKVEVFIFYGEHVLVNKEMKVSRG